MSDRFGKLPFADLFAPAIEIAERGYLAPVVVQQKWAAAATVADLVSQPGFAETFLPRGRAPHVGERVTLPGIARSLRAIAETKGRAFYEGEIAEAMARHAAARPDLRFLPSRWPRRRERTPSAPMTRRVRAARGKPSWR